MRRLGTFLMALAACGPPVLYETPMPDRSSTIAVIEELEGQYVVVRGQKYGPYEGVGIESLAPSPDGQHLAWAAEVDGAWRLIVDGRRAGGDWEGIGVVAWSPRSDRVVYVAQKDARWSVISVDPNEPGSRPDDTLTPSYGSIADKSLRFAKDDEAFGYIGVDGEAAFVVLRGEPRGPFLGAGALAIDDDGSHVAFAALERNGSWVHVDAGRHGPFEDVAELTLAPRLGRFAASVLTEGGWRPLVDGELGQAQSIIGTFTFSADGTHLAWAEATQAEGVTRWFVRVDDAQHGPFGGVAHERITFSRDGSSCAFAASIGAEHFVVQDGARLEGRYRAIDHLTYASRTSSLGYVAQQEEGGAVVVVRGEVKGRWDRANDLALDATGTHWVAAVELSGASLLVADGTPYAFDVVAGGTLTFDERGEHWGAVVGDAVDRGLWFVIDGRPRSRLEWTEIADLVRKDAAQSDTALGERLRQWVRAELARVE